MKKLLLSCLIILSGICITTAQPSSGGGNKQKIAELGDKAWENLIAQYSSAGKFMEPRSARETSAEFRIYEGKLMKFPSIDFQQFITDREGRKYFYTGDKEGFNFFVIKYDDEITEKLRKLTYVFGPVKGSYEVLGVIKESYGWWGSVVLMDIRAIREPGRACVLIDGSKVTLAGEELIAKELEAKELESGRDVPRGLTILPANIDPLMAAKLFFQLSSVERNQDLWKKLLTKEHIDARGQLNVRAQSHWRYLTTRKRSYFYVRVDTIRTNEKQKGYYFQIKEDGVDIGSPKPIVLIREDGEWRVESANP